MSDKENNKDKSPDSSPKETEPVKEEPDKPASEAEAPENTEVSADIISGDAENTGEAASPAEEVPVDAPAEKSAEEDVPLPERKKFNAKKCADKALTGFSYVIPLGILAAVVYYMIYFITVAYKKEFHADCTDTIMWANASIEGGAVYDKDFGYACFLPFGINVIMQPLIQIFGLSMKAHVMGMMGYFLLLTVFFILMLREMHWDIRDICLGTAVMLAMTTSSQKLREIFWQHTIYYSLGLLFIVIGLFLYFRLLNLSGRLKTLKPSSKKGKLTFLRCLIIVVVLSVFIMLTATDGISALSIFAVPFVGAVLAEHFADSSNKLVSKKSLFTVLISGLFGFMIILGGKLNAYWTGDLVAEYQEANSYFSPMSEWMNHIINFPIAWLRLNGVRDMTGVQLSEKDGITNLIYIAASLMLLVMPVIATFFYPKFAKAKDAHMLRIFVWMHWTSSGIVMLGYIVGVLSAADWRLTPVMGTSLFLSILFVHWAVTSKSGASRVVAVLSIPIILMSVQNIKTIKEMPKDGYKDNNLYGIAEFLEDEGLSYGYASFWNANAITIITDSRVKVRDVNIDQYGVSKRIYQSSKNWYKDQEGQKDYFLLMTIPEYRTLSDIQSPLLNEALSTQTIHVNSYEYYVLVFDHNIIPQW